MQGRTRTRPGVEVRRGCRALYPRFRARCPARSAYSVTTVPVWRTPTGCRWLVPIALPARRSLPRLHRHLRRPRPTGSSSSRLMETLRRRSSTARHLANGACTSVFLFDKCWNWNDTRWRCIPPPWPLMPQNCVTVFFGRSVWQPGLNWCGLENIWKTGPLNKHWKWLIVVVVVLAAAVWFKRKLLKTWVLQTPRGHGRPISLSFHQ